MLADTGATLTKALELDLDLSAVLGSVRYYCVVEYLALNYKHYRPFMPIRPLLTNYFNNGLKLRRK